MTTTLNIGVKTLVNSYTTNQQANPKISYLFDGSYVVTWDSFGEDGDGWGTFGQRFDVHGAPVGGEFRVNGATAGPQQHATVVGLAGGGFVGHWTTQTTYYDVHFQRFDADGNAVGGEGLANTTQSGAQEISTGVGLTDGSYLLVWESDGQDPDGSTGIYAQRLSADGVPIGVEFRIDTATDYFQGAPKATTLESGGYVIAWTSRDENGKYHSWARQYAADTTAVAAEFEIGAAVSDFETIPGVTGLADGGYVVVWAEIDFAGGTTSLHAQRYAANGQAAGVNQVVATVHDTFTNPNGGFFGYTSVAALADGGFVVAYADYLAGSGFDVYVRRYDSGGNVLGPGLLVEHATPTSDFRVSVAALAGGGFSVYWDDSDNLYQKTYGVTSDLSGDQLLYGTGGNDTLDGGAGNDTLYGGKGDDTFVVSDAGDLIVELSGGGGTDTVLSSVSYALLPNVEKLTLTGSANIDGTGNSAANTLTGNSGNNLLDGKAGADTLTGGLGNDSFVVDNAADVIVELSGGGGTDTVLASVNYTLLPNVEKLTLTGSANIDGTGNSAANTLIGNSGNNLLNGKTGADTMTGGLGNDTFVIDNAADDIIELSGGGGIDTVQSSISYALLPNVENLTLTGAADLNGTGNSVANILNGNTGHNALGGNSGNDTLNGLSGNDTLTGGAGGDSFVFEAGSGADRISDFTATDNDQININAYSHGVVGGGGVVLSQAGSDTLIDLGGGNTITVVGVAHDDAALLSHIIW